MTRFRGLPIKRILLYAVLCALCGMYLFGSGVVAEQRRLAESVVRLHVVANSDSDADQAVKLAVRDAIAQYLGDMPVDNADDALHYINGRTDEIRTIATDTLRAHGMDYSATVSVGPGNFPTTRYGDVTLPAGTYQAVRVRLGEAAGKNWFCVLFPQLCFNGEGAAMPAPSSAQLREAAGDGAMRIAETDSVTYKLRILEIIDDIKQAVSR